MSLDFDFNTVQVTEFGVGRDDRDSQTFCCVVVDGGVQDALQEMATETSKVMQTLAEVPPRYEPSESHASSEYVYLPLDDNLALRMRELHQAVNLPVESGALSEPSKLFCYFARMTDDRGRHLTALRRAAQFKGILKSRLLHWKSNALRIVEDDVFKLDSDFDLLIDNQSLHILRPSGFEFAGSLREAVLAAVPQNINAIQQELTFVDFAEIQEYASKRPRAARYLASIRSQEEARNIDREALLELCRNTGVQVSEENGTINIQEGHFMGFLEVLERRRYKLELVKDSPEHFRAGKRDKLDGQDGGAA